MLREVAFAGNIKTSKMVARSFREVADRETEVLDQDEADYLRCEVHHVDGTQSMLERNRELDWLRDDPGPGQCRVFYRRRHAPFLSVEVTKDDVFFYVYGLLHSPEYRERFQADLKKSLPRIPKVADFWRFAEAGRRLLDLHLGYEGVDPFEILEERTLSSAL